MDDLDGDDFDGWYRSEHPRVVAAVAAVTGRPSVAGDATDEAFARACERWDRVRDMSAPGGWVTRTALNVARRRLRRADHEGRLLRRVAATQPVEAAPPAWSPEVWDALARLPRREREAVVLRYVADLPVAEVAAVMGTAPGTASSALHAARRRLAADLALDPDPTPDPTSEEASDAHR